MMRLRSAPVCYLVVVFLLSGAAITACGGDADSGGVTFTEPSAGTPFSLGSILSIRGQEVTLPNGVTYVNQSPECQMEEMALSPECVDDPKMLSRGDSYILFDPSIPRVIARRIEPEDESDFRSLLMIIAGTAESTMPSQTPTP